VSVKGWLGGVRLRYRDIDSSTLRNSWHKLSNASDGDDISPSPSPQLLSVHVADNGSDSEEEDEDEDVDACRMYAMCASETSSCRLLFLLLREAIRTGDDVVVVVVGYERVAAVMKERRRKRRVTEVKTARMSGRVGTKGVGLLVRVCVESLKRR